MLRTRLWMGAVLIALVVGVLALDQRFAPVFPCLALLVTCLAALGCWELTYLLPAERRPRTWVLQAAVLGVLAANWLPHLLERLNPWPWIAIAFALAVIAAFLVEMANFREPGESVNRIALTTWSIAYLGLLPSFLAQLRWLDPGDAGRTIAAGTVNIALAVFVPKCCDIGAYFTGRFLGKHKMSPVLSPKKTWEGAAGGILLAAAVAIGINRLDPVLPSLAAEIGFGVTVGIAGMLGDLAESLIKRDCQQKDASQAVPGFGGILDVVDAILFAAPVAYIWLSWI